MGIEIVSSWRGADRKKLGLHMERLRAIAHSPRLTHLIEVNAFFSRLAFLCRNRSATRLVDWWAIEKTRIGHGNVVPHAIRQDFPAPKAKRTSPNDVD